LRNNQEICLVIKPVTARQSQRPRRSQQNPIPQRKTLNLAESSQLTSREQISRGCLISYFSLLVSPKI
jgi:hypothetical protein